MKVVVEELLKRIPSDHLGVSVRDVGRAKELQKRGIRVRRGDYTDPGSLLHAFEGATQVLIVSSNVLGDEAVRQHCTAIDMAKEAGADRILYTSHMSSSPTSHFPPAVDHAATEEALKASGVPFTSMRNGYYTASLPWFLRDALKTGELVAPEDGLVAWTTHADLAAATATVLSEQNLSGLTPSLTATEALDLEEIAAILMELTGRLIRRVVVSDDEFRAQLIYQGLQDRVADMFMTFFLASRAGEFAPADPTLVSLVGRPSITV
ncbi:NmrA family NAD(P)-binding protein [Paenibacillus sp. FSL R5-0378]|uniref:NmrA family NAD(P)-binding protein n=1 Tax=Paenibacillus sp. FSL R5-0378 TaxID=2921637 RepID=UPI002449641B|nr:NAD(P)H-binding protein [Paenibacillus rhizosphaerae]